MSEKKDIQQKIGIDLGFSHVKYSTGIESTGKYITAVAEVRGINSQSADDIYELEGKYYYVGENALKQSSNNIIDVGNYNNLEYFAPILILHAIKSAGLDPKNIKKICLGLSLSHLEQGQSFKKRVSNFIVDSIEYKFDIYVIAQGIGAILALDSMDKIEDEDILLLDGGFNTLDAVFLYDRKIQTSRLNGDHAFENRGITRVAQELMSKINDMNIVKEISIKDAQKALLDGKFKHRGKIYELEEIIKECVSNYTKDLMKFLENKYGGDIDKMSSVYIVGGLAYVINPNIEGYEDGFIKTFKDSEYLNAIGNYLHIKDK